MMSLHQLIPEFVFNYFLALIDSQLSESSLRIGSNQQNGVACYHELSVNRVCKFARNSMGIALSTLQSYLQVCTEKLLSF